MKILLVEDDRATAELLTQVLSAHHYSVDVASDGETGLELAESFDYDLLLLDILLPKLDGICLCQKLRSWGYQVPILLLTAKDSSGDLITGLDAGADDYVVKPFNLSELLARIRALLRRGSSTLAPVLIWENLHFNTKTKEVTYNHTLLHLTPKESNLLELFLLHPGRIFSRSAILDHLWSLDASPDEGAVSTHIKTLRQKLKAAGAEADFIETLYGQGHRLKPLLTPEPPTKTMPESAFSISQTTELFKPENCQSEQLITTELSQIWRRYSHYFDEHLQILQQMIGTLAAGTLDIDRQQQAKQTAHKLAGSLGVFGFENGSKLAKQIETLLQPEIILEAGERQQLLELSIALQQSLQQPPNFSASDLAAKPLKAAPPNPLLLIVDDDEKLGTLITTEAIAQGLQVETASTLASARIAIAQHAPNAILLDLTLSNENGLTLLQELAQQGAKVPVLVLTQHGGLRDRVEVARLGGYTFLQKNLPPKQILQAVMHALQPAETYPAKVLIVDDDPQILITLQCLLNSYGLQATTLNDSQQFWEVLTTCQPNLLVLDLEMPTFNGIDLCRVVRQDPYWCHLPILILTVHTDLESMERSFQAGATDVITKPFIATQLATQIVSRLQGDRGLWRTNR